MTPIWYAYPQYPEAKTNVTLGICACCPTCGKTESETIARIATGGFDWVTAQKCACGQKFIWWH
jgi:hypothetical protein